MPTVIVRHKVDDIDAWLNGHQDRLELFAPAMSGFKTFQDTEDPNSVVLVVEVTDMEKFAAILQDPKNEQVKARHTVLDPIIMSVAVEV